MFQEQKRGSPDYITRIMRASVDVVPVIIVIIAVLFLAGCGGHVNHKVEQGESLYSIGFYYGHDYRDIAKWNGISPPYVINKGQWLRVAPPDNNKWWDEERKIASNQRFSKRSPVSSSSGKGVEKGVRSNRRQRKDTRRQNKADKRHSKIIVEDFTDKSGKITQWVWPTKGRLINPDKKFSHRKKGIDIAGKRGQLIFATSAGKVVYSGSGLIGYGKLIIIKHNKTYLSAYAHNEKILVAEGDIVKRGQRIAHMGRTPDNHIQLHFEIRRNGKPVDPLRFLKR